MPTWCYKTSGKVPLVKGMGRREKFRLHLYSTSSTFRLTEGLFWVLMELYHDFLYAKKGENINLDHLSLSWWFLMFKGWRWKICLYNFLGRISHFFQIAEDCFPTPGRNNSSREKGITANSFLNETRNKVRE